MKELVSSGRKVGEVQMFAMLPRYGGARVQVAESLFSAALKVLLEDGYDDAVFWLQGAQSRFFARSLGGEPMSCNMVELGAEAENVLLPFRLNLQDLSGHGSGSFPLLVLKGDFTRALAPPYRLSDEEVALLLIHLAQMQGRITLEEAQLLIASYPGAAAVMGTLLESEAIRLVQGTSP